MARALLWVTSSGSTGSEVRVRGCRRSKRGGRVGRFDDRDGGRFEVGAAGFGKARGFVGVP